MKAVWFLLKILFMVIFHIGLIAQDIFVEMCEWASDWLLIIKGKLNNRS